MVTSSYAPHAAFFPLVANDETVSPSIGMEHRQCLELGRANGGRSQHGILGGHNEELTTILIPCTFDWTSSEDVFFGMVYHPTISDFMSIFDWTSSDVVMLEWFTILL